MAPTVATDVAGSDLVQPALDTLPSNIAILDADGRILVTNSSWRAFAEANDIQMSPGTVDVNYLDIAEAADDAYADRAVTGLQAVLRDEHDQFELEYPCHSPNEKRWFLLRAAGFTHDGARYATVAHIDITERREREQELQETSEMFRSVQQTFASTDSFDEKLEDLLAFGRDYLDVETGFFARIDDDTLEIRVAAGPNEDLQADASVPLSKTYCRHTIDTATADLLTVTHASEEGWEDDSAFERFNLECYVGATILVDGEVEGTICFADHAPADEGFTDPQQTFVELLSEWAGSELSHRKQERQYRRLTERISDAYYALDSDWTVTYWNDIVADRVGVPAENIVGTNFWKHFPELERTVYEDTLREAMQSQEPQSCEFYYDERDYWVNVWAYPDEKGISVISQDITERKEHEQELADRRDELADLNRLNTLVRELMQALQDTDSRKAIETAVCDRLTESALYQSAWIGVRGANAASDQTVIPQTAAGIEEDYLDDIPNIQGPAKAAVQTGDIQVVDDIATAAGFPDERRQRALECGHHALAAVPLATGDMTYGVLVVYLPEAQSISDGERAILADLGQMVGQAIQRVHSQQALSAEAVVTLDLQIPDTDLVVGDASIECDCELILEQQITTADTGAIYYFSVHDTDPADVCRFLEETPLDANCSVVREASDDRPSLIEFHLAERPNLPTDVVQNYGGSVRTARITDGDVYLGVELPPTVDVRTVVDALRAVAPGTRLLRKQYVDRPIETAPTHQNQITEQLTPKQESTLQAAYARGYYAWPRDVTVEELAETFDISAPTLHYRLRKAHQTIIASVIDDPQTTDT